MADHKDPFFHHPTKTPAFHHPGPDGLGDPGSRWWSRQGRKRQRRNGWWFHSVTTVSGWKGRKKKTWGSCFWGGLKRRCGFWFLFVVFLCVSRCGCFFLVLEKNGGFTKKGVLGTLERCDPNMHVQFFFHFFASGWSVTRVWITISRWIATIEIQY